MPVKYAVRPKRVTLAAAKKAAKMVKKGALKVEKKAVKKPVTAKIMNPKIKAKWLDALKSGKYAKGRSALKTKVGYCCLGVLCDIYAKTRRDGSKFVTDKHNEIVFMAKGETKGAMGFLPDTVAKWAGIDSHVFMASADIQGELANVNDQVESFEPVIDIIEKTL